jgi:Acetyltransferase (GNAT) domain
MDIINSSLNKLPEAVVKRLRENDVNFFSSYAWYQNFIDNVVSVDKGHYEFIMAENQLILPVEHTVLSNGCRQLKSLTNYYSPIYQLIHDKILDTENIASDFFGHLKIAEKQWDVLNLQPMAIEDVAFLSRQLQKAKIPSVSFFCFGNWYLEVNGRSFAEYFSGLPSRVKNTSNRKTKQFEKIANAEITIITDHQNLAAGIEAYEKVYQSSWKNPEPYPDFMSGLMTSAATLGCLRLGVAYLDQQPIAAQLWIVANNTAYIFKLAYDEEYKNYAPGTILTTKLMEYVIDQDKVATVDYLCGDDSYKEDWMSHRRERWGVNAFNTDTFRGNIEMCKEMSKRYIKKIARMF